MAKKIVIDAGHGGEDPGTSANGIIEKNKTLEISKYLHKRFNELGIENAMTRDSDITLGPSDRPKKVQSFYGNGNDVIVLSNHINAGGGDGAEIIYALRNSSTLAKKIADEFTRAGQNVRKYYQRRLPSDPSKDYYYILRDTPNNESVIIEYGFADSSGDDPNLLKEDWQDLAEAVVRAVASYAGVTYKQAGDSTNTYVVSKGDTLWGIARKYGVSVEELKNKNNLTSNSLSIGQVLLIPGSDNTHEYYTVNKGDTLYSIAKRYGTSVSALKEINNLSSNNLSVGQKLKIANNTSDVPNNINTYAVKAGDNLYKIARENNVSVSEIKSLNNLNSDSLSIGQILKIPSSNSANVIYTVKAGDNLYAIARDYNTTVDAIKKRNNLTSNLLSIGQKLIIP